MTYILGSEATFEAMFTDSKGEPVDPETVRVDVWDSQSSQFVDNGVPVRIDSGIYSYTFLIPADSPTGLWKIQWEALVGEFNSFGEESFVVQSGAVVVTPLETVMHSRLRSRLGEVGQEADGSDTMFTATDIADILSYAENDLNLATYEGWKRKVARLARLIDVGESGSDRLLSQRFRQAKSMLDFWGGIVSESDAARLGAMTGRVVGSVINLRRVEPLEHPGTPFSGYTEHIRMYPTKRLLIPAVLS